MKNTVHFVYTVPYTRSIITRILEKIVSGIPFYRTNHNLINWPTPIHAPHSITYNLLRKLKNDFKVKLYEIGEKGDIIKLMPDDILIFHPTVKYKELSSLVTWEIDKDSSAWIALQKYSKTNKIIILVPYTHQANQYLLLKDYFEYTQNFIIICGEYWINTWHQSPYKDILREKPLQVNMGINAKDYLVVKTKLNPKGKRKFLYIGNTLPWKNTRELEKIAEHIDGFEGGYISYGEIKGWKKITDFAHLTTELMRKLSQEYDFFLSTSSADAQATTIAEQICFGMVVACTPESGYTHTSVIELHTNDTAYNCKQIQKMQEMQEDEYFQIANQNLKEAVTSHSWDSIYNSIYIYINQIKLYEQ